MQPHAATCTLPICKWHNSIHGTFVNACTQINQCISVPFKLGLSVCVCVHLCVPYVSFQVCTRDTSTHSNIVMHMSNQWNTYASWCMLSGHVWSCGLKHQQNEWGKQENWMTGLFRRAGRTRVLSKSHMCQRHGFRQAHPGESRATPSGNDLPVQMEITSYS